MKTKKIIIITACALSMFGGQWSNVLADDFVPAVETVPNNTSTSYTLDSGNSGGDITLQFGGTLAQTLKWNSSTSRFNLSAPLDITGNMTTSTGSTMSGGVINLNDSSNFAVNVGTGTSTGTVTLGGTGAQTIAVGNGAGAKTVSVGSNNTTSTTTILSGSGGVLINDANNQPTTINGGTSTGAVSIASGSGTQTVSLGDGSTGVKTITLGSTNTTSTTNILSGSGAVNMNLNNNQPTNLNTGTSTGTVTIGNNGGNVVVNSNVWDITGAGVASGLTGITSAGGAISFNNNSNFAVDIATGTSTGTVTLGGTGAQTIAVGNGAGVKTVNVGSNNTTSTTTILSGSGGVLINDANNQPTTINGGTSTGAVSIASGSGTQTVSLGDGSTGVKTITLGSTNTTSTTNILSGSGAVNMNASNNQPTNINTGSSTGAVSIGNAAAGAVSITSGGAFTLAGGAASTVSTTAGDIILQPSGTGTIANVEIGAGGAGSTTPDFLALDVKSTTGDPAGGAEGYMYYNTFDNKFRCFQGSAWTNCAPYRQKVVLGSDVSVSTPAATYADVTGLSFPVSSGVLTAFECTIYYTSAATTTGSMWAMNGPTTTALMYQSEYTLTATTSTRNGMVQAYNSPAAANATSAAGSNLALINGYVLPSANGTMIARFATEVNTSAITAKAGSNCEWW